MDDANKLMSSVGELSVVELDFATVYIVKDTYTTTVNNDIYMPPFGIGKMALHMWILMGLWSGGGTT